MKKLCEKKWWKPALCAAMVLAMLVPMMTMAESEPAETPEEQPQIEQREDKARNKGTSKGRQRGNVKGNKGAEQKNAPTEEQAAAYDAALAVYQDAEVAVLNDLAAAGVVAQADVDAYVSARDAKASLDAIDKSGWTAEESKAFKAAQKMTGDERKAAFDSMAEQGLITSGQADALTAMGKAGLWQDIMKNQKDNADVQAALATMREARETFNQSLRDAGIRGKTREFGNDERSPGQRDGKHRNSENGKKHCGSGKR